MARSREILLALVLLAVAAAPVRGCQAEVLAPTVALFCVRSLPADRCCQALSHSAAVGGGARCLCRLADEAPLVSAALNGTDLLRLYAACVASSGHGHGGAAPSLSTCDGKGGAPAAAPRDGTGCGTAVLADQMGLFCRGGRSPSPPCCEAVVGSAHKGNDGVPCFCRVAQLSGSFGVGRISRLYAACVASGPGPQPPATSPATCARGLVVATAGCSGAWACVAGACSAG